MRKLLGIALSISLVSNVVSMGVIQSHSEQQRTAMSATAQAVEASAAQQNKVFTQAMKQVVQSGTYDEYFTISDESEEGWLADSIQSTVFFDETSKSSKYVPKIGDRIKVVFANGSDELIKVEKVEGEQQ